MFDTDIKIQGIYATHLKSLARDPKNPGKPYIFERYIDVYMNAAVIGLLEGEPVLTPDSSDNDSARIFAEVVIKERRNFMFLYRLVMLLDRSTGLTAEERIDRAFRDEGDDKHPEKMIANMKLFHGYAYAGIEIMYDKIAARSGTVEDMCDAAHTMMKDFREKLEDITPEEYLRKYHLL